jgi:hypothetical protein
MHVVRSRKLEMLESRAMLASTADIVFIIDESASSAPTDVEQGKAGHSEHYWLHKMIPVLDARLDERGIADNRFGLVGFGRLNTETEPLSRGILLDVGLDDNEANDSVFGNADEVLDAIDNEFKNAGGNEDGWDGLARAINILSPVNEPIYEFRPEAAVHFILISDEVRDFADGSVNEDLDLFMLLAELRSENLETTGQDVLEDAVLTAVTPAGFTNIVAWWSDEIGPDPILGIDIHVADTVDVDMNSDDPEDDILPGTMGHGRRAL